MKQIVGVLAAAGYLTAYGFWSMATVPFRWTWRAALGMSTAMAGPEAGYPLACLFLLLAAMGIVPCLVVGACSLL